MGNILAELKERRISKSEVEEILENPEDVFLDGCQESRIIGLYIKKLEQQKKYWDFVITVKHPSMEGKEEEVITTLKDPEFVRESKKDERIRLYYRRADKKYMCVVCKHLNGEGFIITTYITDKVKEEIWKKS